MRKLDPRSVEEIASQRRHGRRRNFRLARRAVQRVANHRMADCRKMYANLMRAARMQVSFDERKSRQTQTHSPIRARRPPFPAPRGHTNSTMQVARDGKLDAPRTFVQLAVNQCKIRFFNLVTAELFCERAMRQIISRNQQRARSFAVEAMHNSRPQLTADGRKFATAAKFMQQRVDHRAAL